MLQAILPLLLGAGGAALMKRAGDSQRQAEQDLAWQQGQAENVTKILQLAAQTGDIATVHALEPSAKKYNIDITPYVQQVHYGAAGKNVRAIGDILAGGTGAAQTPLTPDESLAMQIGTGSAPGELPTPTEQTISPELAKNAKITVGENGLISASFAAPGVGKVNLKERIDENTGERYFEKYDEQGNLIGTTPRQKLNLTPAEKSQELAIIETADPQGKVLSQRLAFVGPGYAPPPGTTVKPFSKGTTIQIMNDLTTKAKNDMQGELIGSVDALQKLNIIEQLTIPDYFEYLTQGQVALSSIFSKLPGNALTKKVLEKLHITSPDEFVESFRAWQTAVDVNTMLWRKFITGVAGGPAEMARIEGITPNKATSYQEFVGTIKTMKLMALAAQRRADYFLTNGINLAKMSPEERVKLYLSAPLSNFGFMTEADLSPGSAQWLKGGKK